MSVRSSLYDLQQTNAKLIRLKDSNATLWLRIWGTGTEETSFPLICFPLISGRVIRGLIMRP